MQKVIIVEGRNSYLLNGDNEAHDDRFYEQDNGGILRGIALPVLLQEGWKIDKINEMGNSVLILLKTNDDENKKEKGDEK